MARWNADKRKWEFAAGELETKAEAALTADRLKDEDAVVEPVAIAVSFLPAERRFRLDLSNGTTYLFPSELCQGLRDAAAEDLADVRIRPGGEALHWPRLDEDYSVTALVMGIFGSDRWMRQMRQEMGRSAGKARSDAKAQAARLNGRKGGKPSSIYRYVKSGPDYEVHLGRRMLGHIQRAGNASTPRWLAREAGTDVYPTREEAARALHAGVQDRKLSK